MVERMLPLYEDAVITQNRDMSGLSPEARGSLARGKMAAADIIEGLEPVLFPVDDDG